MQTQTSNTLHNAIMEAGSKDRPPMLAPEKQVLISDGSLETRTERFQDTYKNVSQYIRDQLNAKAKAVQIILTGTDNDIYSTVDTCPNACEIWKAIKRLKQGESINVQDLETNLFWEFGKFTSQDDKMADMTAPSSQAPTVAPPVRTDEEIVPRIRWVQIGKSNCYLDLDKKQNNPIYKMAVYLLMHTNFHRAFTASSTIPSIYIQQFWDTIQYDKKAGSYRCQLDEQLFVLTKDTLREALQITPVNNNQAFIAPPSADVLVNFVNQLGYPKLVRNVSNIVTNDMFKPWRALTTIINLCFTGKTYGFERPRAPVLQILWGIVTQSNIDYAERIWEEFTQSIHTFIDDKRYMSRNSSRLACTDAHQAHQEAQVNSTRAESEAEDVPIMEPQIAAGDAELQKVLEESMKTAYAAAPRGPLPPVVIKKPESGKYQPLPEVPGKGKAKVTEEQVAHDLLSLQKPKKKSPAEQYIFQRRISEPARSSLHDDSPYAVLGQSDSEEESEKVMLGATEGGNDEDQAGPDPGAQAEGQTGTDAGNLNEGQAGSNLDEMSKGQAGPDPGNAGDKEQSIPSPVVHAGSDREYMDLDVADVLPQPSMEQLDEGFTATAYPKVQESLKLAVKEQVLLEEPASSSRTLSSLQHLIKDISSGDIFFSDRPSDVDKNAETEVESMVNVPIQQAMSSISLMISPIIDLTSRPDTAEAMMVKRIDKLEHIMANLIQVNKEMEERLEKHRARLFTLEQLDIPQQVSIAVSEVVTDAVDWAMQAPLRNRFKDLPEADMKEILHQRMWETESYKTHKEHKQLFEALKKSMNRDHSEELAQDLAEARKKKKKSRESPKMPPGSPSHQPPPPLPPAGPSGPSGAPVAFGSSHAPPPPPPPSTSQESLSKGSVAPSPSKIAASAEYQAWMTTDVRLRPSISLTLADLEMDEDASALASNYSPPPEDSLLAQTGDMATFIDWFCKRRVTIQSDFFFNNDLEYLRYGSKGSRPALSISKMKAAYYPDAGLEQMVPDQFWINEEYKYDIAAIQLVIRQRVEDFQLGIKSYQTQLNLTKPQWDATGFEYKHDYTVIDSPRAVIFWDKYKVQMMMRFNEIHKFSNGTLQQIDEGLDYRVKEFRINMMNPGLNTRFWTRKDIDRCKAFLFAIQRRLRTRRIFRNLESFVGGREIYKPTNNNLRTSSNTSRANQDNSPRINRGTGYENQRLGNVAGARETVCTTVVQKFGIQCYNCKEFGHVARECQKPKRAKDAAYHREKMLLCKQEEARIQLNAEPIFDTEPVQKVQPNDTYNVFAIESKHPKQSESINDTYPIEQDKHNVTIDSLDMSYDREQIDQNDDDNDLANERELIASLIEKLKCEIDDNKNRNKFLETTNKILVEKLKGEIDDFKNKNKSLESSNNHFKEANNKLSKTNKLLYDDFKKSEAELARRDSMEYASKIKLYKSRKDKELDKVIALENKVKVLDNIIHKTGQSVQTMNMLNSKSRTSFAKPEFLKKAQSANPRLYDIGLKCTLLCLFVLEKLNALSTNLLKPIRKTVNSESNQKPRNTKRKLYERVSKTCSWWYLKFTPSRYNWKPKSKIGNVNLNVSMPLGNASRTANVLDPQTS
nr:hypothetical protein [Tanacetum cinerariifolium]